MPSRRTRQDCRAGRTNAERSWPRRSIALGTKSPTDLATLRAAARDGSIEALLDWKPAKCVLLCGEAVVQAEPGSDWLLAYPERCGFGAGITRHLLACSIGRSSRWLGRQLRLAEYPTRLSTSPDRPDGAG